MHFPEPLQSVIQMIQKLPGVGKRTAQRFAFELLYWPQEELQMFSETLLSLRQKVPLCKTCGCFSTHAHCEFCDLALRDSRSLCILGSARDVYAIEETKSFRGLYHVIEHVISPLDGRSANQIRIERIQERISQHKTEEVILAFDSTLEGDVTSLFLKKELENLPIKISRLAFGLPVGSCLDHIDGGTLSRALTGRQLL